MKTNWTPPQQNAWLNWWKRINTVLDLETEAEIVSSGRSDAACKGARERKARKKLETQRRTARADFRARLGSARHERRAKTHAMRLGIDLGSTRCQPVGLGSLPRRGIGVGASCVCKDVAGRAAGNYRLAACAPQKMRARSPEKCARNSGANSSC